MRILLTNDDGVFAPGLAALEQQLRHLGEVIVVAPTTEQSGVGHSITFLTPLVCKSIHRDGRHWAWAVDGSPADCVKLAIGELLKDNPVDLVVSGINNGLNAGINVLYSGTVAAAIEGAFFGVTSVAVSLEYDEDPDFQAAAVIARNVVGGIAQATYCPWQTVQFECSDGGHPISERRAGRPDGAGSIRQNVRKKTGPRRTKLLLGSLVGTGSAAARGSRRHRAATGKRHLDAPQVRLNGAGIAGVDAQLETERLDEGSGVRARSHEAALTRDS